MAGLWPIWWTAIGATEVTLEAAVDRFHPLVRATLNKSPRGRAPRFGMGCKAQTTAIAQLWRGFATPQTAQTEDDRLARDLLSVALILLCHKSSFALARPQQGHCPRRAMSAWLKLSRSVVIEWAT